MNSSVGVQASEIRRVCKFNGKGGESHRLSVREEICAPGSSRCFQKYRETCSVPVDISIRR